MDSTQLTTAPRAQGLEIEMTTTIYVADTVSAAAFARVESLAAATADRDINWNGETIKVERGDFTCVEGSDELRDTILLNAVDRAISGEDE